MTKSAFALKISEAKYRVHREIERSSKAYMRELLPTTGALEVLDVGCGTGVNAAQIRRLGHRVIGVDLSPTAVGAFHEGGFPGVVADASGGLPFDGDRFDLVFASEIVEHLVDGQAFLRELCRVTRPGGTLLLSTPNSAFWVYRIYAVAGRTLSDVQHPGHVRFYAKRSLTELVEKVGFADVRCAARHMYLILFGRLPERLGSVLSSLGFCRELRFKTGTHFWHLSRFSQVASPLWPTPSSSKPGSPKEPPKRCVRDHLPRSTEFGQ